MQTAVIMKRKLFDGEIRQNSKTEFFSATDLFKQGNKWRILNDLSPLDMSVWLKQKNVQEFMKTLEDVYGTIKISGRGRGVHTWVHPYLFIDMALAINPKLKIKVYSWIYDSLIKYRNDSGDSYKKMTGALYLTLSNKRLFKEVIIDVAKKIKIECNVTNWQEATEEQLKLRDKIHEYIALLSDIIRDVDNLVEVAIKKSKDSI